MRFDTSSRLHPANLYRYQLISGIIQKWQGPKARIIDLGCGNGSLLKHLKQRGIGRTLIGVDGSQEVIKKNTKAMPFASFFFADLQACEKLPFKCKADIVVCSEVIEHIPHYQAVFQLAWSCLDVGGLFILTTQGGKRRRHDIFLLGHLRHYKIEDLAAEVAENGFKILQKQKMGWPALTIQKAAASFFMNKVKNELASGREPSRLFQLACWIIGCALKVSSKKHGPQLLVISRKKNT